MSVYIPTIWKNNTVPSINAENLNHLEVGANSAHVEVRDIVVGNVTVGQASTAKLALSVRPASRIVVGGIRMWVDESNPVNPIGYIEV